MLDPLHTLFLARFMHYYKTFIVDIFLRLRPKALTLDQRDLKVEFMVQGKYSTLTYKQTTTNIFYIFSDFLLTNKINATYLYKMG